MESIEWPDLIEKFIYARERAPGTREQYRLSVRTYIEWCGQSGVDPFEAGVPDVLAFRELCLNRGLKPATVNTRLYGLRSFYAYLVREGLAKSNPTAEIRIEGSANVRDVLTLDQLLSMWNSADGSDRVVIGLLAMCAVRRTELQAARVEHFVERDTQMVMSLPARKARHDLGYVAVPPQLAQEIRAQIGDRRAGVLLPGFRGRGKMSPEQVRTVIDRVVKRVGIPFRVTALTLNFTLRALAVENRFSYLSVVRSVAEAEPRRLAEWANRIDLPYSEHASIRLGRMLEAGTDERAAMFARAEFLLGDRYQHPAVALLLAAATLERVLRELTEMNGIEVRKKDPTLSTYATLLRGNDHVSLADLRTIDRILGFRNDAAHGFFELVSREQAQWVVREAREIADRLLASYGQTRQDAGEALGSKGSS